MPIEKGEILVIDKKIKSYDIVFDVGFNIGNWSKEVIAKYPDVIIHAFDPLSISNFKINNICFNQLALSNNNTSKKFYYYNIYPPVSTLYRRSPEVEKINIGCTPEEYEITTITLDYYCEKYNIKNINFLKIDVEGSEFDVLNGSLKMLNNIHYIQFEYGGCNTDSNTTLKMLYDFLKKYNFNVFKILPDGLLEIKEFSEALEDYQLNNFLAENLCWKK